MCCVKISPLRHCLVSLTTLAALQVAAAVSAATEYRYRVVAELPHDPQVFTQGLLYHEGRFYESGGLYGASRVLLRTLDSAKPEQQRWLDRRLFAEGLTLLNGKLYQLTWKAGRCLVYDATNLQPRGSFPFPGEGWGLTTDGRALIASNGSDQLLFLDPDNFQVLRQLPVRLNGQPLDKLNELEWVEGKIYANIWKSDRLAIIDPVNGEVNATVDLSGLLPRELSGNADVLNGIAYDPKQQRLWVTGKLWPRLYQIELLPPGKFPKSTSKEPLINSSIN